ncbi:PoNe immunity protein domain-containing protein [Variovorax boronicumulans]
MSSFSSKRREQFLNEEPSSVRRLGLHEDIADAQLLLDTSLGKEGFREDGWFAWNWAIASAKRRLLVHSYSDGSPMEHLAADFPGVLAAQEPSSLPHPLHETEPFFLEELDSYHYAMTFLSLAKLLCRDDLVPRVVALFDVAYTDNRGKDALYEALLGKLGLPTVPAKGMLRFLKAHPLLLKAIEAEPRKRPLFVAELLKKWYPAMKGTAWHGLHDKIPQSFDGYWAFEAGLVTYLWDIDDSSYRDLPFYPKDLVDYARTHGAVASPDTCATLAAQDGPPTSPRSGEACPK